MIKPGSTPPEGATGCAATIPEVERAPPATLQKPELLFTRWRAEPGGGRNAPTTASPCQHCSHTGDVLRLGRMAGNTLNGGWSSWTSWSQCSRDCSRGIRSRKRTCNNPEPKYGGQSCQGPAQEYQECNVTPCPGKEPAPLQVWARKRCTGVEIHSVSDRRHKTKPLQISGVTDPNLHQESGTNPCDAEVCNHMLG